MCFNRPAHYGNENARSLINSNAMRIVLVTHFFPPRHNAGTENYTLGVARALVTRGHTVSVVCANDWSDGAAYWNGVIEERVDDGFPVHRVNLNWTKASDANRVLYDSQPAEEWFAGVLSEAPPDIVHVTSAATLGVGVLRAARRSGARLILTLMDFWFLCARTLLVRGRGQLCDGRTSAWDCQRCLLESSHVFQRLEPWMPPPSDRLLWGTVAKLPALSRLRGARGMALDMSDRKSSMKEALGLPDVVISHSRFVQQVFAASELSDRIRHIPNGHDLSWLDGYSGKAASAVTRVGYMGQVVEAKGIHTLVAAFQRSERRGLATLDIWGDLRKDPSYADRLRSATAGSDDIVLRGRFEHDDLAAVLTDVDVLVVPSSWYENSPLVIQEAFATRTPVIATDLGGMAEAVTHNVNGLLFERGSVEDLACQLRRVIDEPSLLSNLAAGISRVKTVDEEVDELEATYHQALAG